MKSKSKANYSESSSLIQNTNKTKEKVKLYRRRWFILINFILIQFCNVVQVIQYVSITNAVVKYYKTNLTTINWTFLVFLLFFIPLSFPSTYLMQKLTIRSTVLMGSVVTAAGAWIKVGGNSPSRLWVVMLGQCVTALVPVQLQALPPKLAAVWFGAKEVSTACSMGILAIPISNSLGFLLPTLIVDSTDDETIQKGLYQLSILYAGLSTCFCAIAFLFFEERPPTPPTKVTVKCQRKTITLTDYFKSIKEVFTNPSFVYLFIGFAVNIGMCFAMFTVLNPLIMMYYSDASKEVGVAGLIWNINRAYGCVFAGIILDRCKKYRLIVWSTAFLCLVTTATLCIFITKGIFVVYNLVAVYGIATGALLPMGFELGIELTYPLSESMLGGFIIMGPQIFAIIFSYLFSYLLENTSPEVTNLAICGCLVIGDIFFLPIKFNLKRQAALKDELT